MPWRGGARFGTQGAGDEERQTRESGMSVEAFQSFLALAFGFAFAGLISSGYQLVAARPASFRMLQSGRRAAALAAVPFLVFAAPFIIGRSILRGGGAGPQRVEIVMMATVVAGFWSLMSGTVVVMAVQALGAYL